MMASKSVKEAGDLLAMDLLKKTFEKQFPGYEISFKKKELFTESGVPLDGNTSRRC